MSLSLCMASHRAILVSYQVLYFNLGVLPSCRKYQTGNQCTKPLPHPSGRVILISHRFVVAYRKPIEALFYHIQWQLVAVKGLIMTLPYGLSLVPLWVVLPSSVGVTPQLLLIGLGAS